MTADKLTIREIARDIRERVDLPSKDFPEVFDLKEWAYLVVWIASVLEVDEDYERIMI